jgi:hypothetical protein
MRRWRSVFDRRRTAIVVVAAAALTAALGLVIHQSRRSTALSAPAVMAAPATRTPGRPVPFKAGETLEYDVSWASFLTAGSATVAVRDTRPSFDSTAYYIVAEGRPNALLARLYTLHYKADTLLDAFTLLPQRGSILSQEGRRQRLQTVRFDQAHRTADYEMTTNTVVKRTLKLRGDTQDPLSALYVMRSFPLRRGFQTTMDVANADQLLRVRISVQGRESVVTPAGTFDAWRVSPLVTEGADSMKGRALSVWISDTDRRLPVKIEADMPVGKIALTLRAARG